MSWRRKGEPPRAPAMRFKTRGSEKCAPSCGAAILRSARARSTAFRSRGGGNGLRRVMIGPGIGSRLASGFEAGKHELDEKARRVVLQEKLAIVKTGDGLGEAQAETRAWKRAGAVEAHETFGDPAPVRLGDAGAA